MGFYSGGEPICDADGHCDMYLAADLRVASSDPEYLFYATAAAGFLGGYVFGIPAFFCFMLYRNQHILAEYKKENQQELFLLLDELKEKQEKEKAAAKKMKEKQRKKTKKQGKLIGGYDSSSDDTSSSSSSDDEIPELPAKRSLEAQGLAALEKNQGKEAFDASAPGLVFTQFHSDGPEECSLELYDIKTAFSVLDVTHFTTFTLEKDGGKVKLRRTGSKSLIEVKWKRGKAPYLAPSHAGRKYTLTFVTQMVSGGDKINGEVGLSNGFSFFNPAAEEVEQFVQCVRLWGTLYRPKQFLQDPKDSEAWTDGEPSSIIKVSHGPSFRSGDPDSYIPQEWTVELANGAIFENPTQHRDYRRVSAPVAALAWLGQAYEYQFWYWEMVEFTRKLTLSAVVVYVKPGSSVQILYAIFVSVLFLGFVSYYKPYEEDDDDTFSFMSFICLVFTLVLGLALRVSKTESLTPADVMGFSYVMLFVNVQVIGMLLQVLFEKLCGIKLSDFCKCLKACCKGNKRDLANLAGERAGKFAQVAGEKAQDIGNKVKPT